jgi:hypothetical protein
MDITPVPYIAPMNTAHKDEPTTVDALDQAPLYIGPMKSETAPKEQPTAVDAFDQAPPYIAAPKEQPTAVDALDQAPSKTTQTRRRFSQRLRFCARVFICAFLLLLTGLTIDGLYKQIKKVDDLRHVQPSNCTIVGAEFDMGDWAIHVNFTVPTSYHKPANTTHVTLLDGTDANAEYSVNQTLSCFASTHNIDVVSLTRKAAGGGTIILIIFLLMGLIAWLLGLFRLTDTEVEQPLVDIER